ncbi:MAG: hypothetical protein JWN36_2707 [Microbacteriaceae bacterium]|nr:hypothetical protein [Microbacteriaceae bacterium]
MGGCVIRVGRDGRAPMSRRARNLLAAGTAAVLVAASALVGAVPAFAAPTLGLSKTASVAQVQPGGSYTYTMLAQCSGLTDACINATLTDTVPADVDVTTLPTSNTTRTVTYNATTRLLTVAFISPLPPPSPAGSVGLTAGSSQNIVLGVQLPAASQIADGATISNTASFTATGATPVADTADVTAVVPRVVTPVATKAWSDGSAIAGSGAASAITLGVRNASSSSAQVSQLVVDDTVPAVFDRFDVTGIGPVTFPTGADRVTVLACTVVLSACTDADFTASAPQAGPTLSLPVPAGDVTALRFAFTSSAGTVLPSGGAAGSVDVAITLRSTLRSTGAQYSPTTRDDVQNCTTPSAVDPVAGTVAGAQACATFSVQPAQATIAMGKTFFSDTNGDYTADGNAVLDQNSLVSALVTSRNTSPFAVSTMTITEPSATAPNEFAKLDVSQLRIVFPAGATDATLVIDCGAGDVRTLSFTAPPTTVNQPVPCDSGRAAGVTATFTGAIAQNAVATLGLQGRLNALVTSDDLSTGGSPGVSNCADGTATSSLTGVGSAAANACASVTVLPAFAQVNGVKRAQLPTILPDLPRRFDLSFTNNGTIAATGVVLADPADPTATPNAFTSLQLQSLTLPGTPGAVAELYDPNVGAYVPYDTAILARATGFRVTLAGPLAPGATYALSAQMLLRPGVPVNTQIQNCAAISTATQPSTPFCAPLITVLPQSAGASVQKSISPATSVRPEPGLPGQPVQVKFAAQNTGTLWLKRLQVLDNDTAFFDAVDVTGTVRVNFPPAANRVEVDVCTGACGPTDWLNGPVSASQSPPLNAGVVLSQVRGFRVTFTVNDNSFTIRPGTNFPTTGLCTGASVCIGVTPRATLHSSATTPVPTVLSDTASGGYETTQQNGALAPIPNSSATHTLTAGTASLGFTKTTSNPTAGPGEVIPFTLTATNAGTGPIPDLVIVDPLPAQLTFSPGNPAAPYTIVYTLPSGATQPATVDFTPISDTNGTVTSLHWQFPGWSMVPGARVAITIETTLAPGVVAGQVVEDRAGDSTSRTDATCAPGGQRPGTAVNDPAYGSGTYCTSGATVQTTAGNAFQTEKWVSGDPTLGWLNSVSGELLPAGDASCPRLTVGGEQFTRYPCVARVTPGQGFDFYLRLTNAGTNPATQVRLVDVLPALGDTGVLLTGDQRGTQWEAPPTLLTPVTLTGPGTLTASYTAANPACTTDLNRAPVPCAPSDWALGYSPTAAAFRAFVDFPTPLAPGGSSALRFRMAAPPVEPNASQNEVAWNSFAHTEFFNQGGTIVQLPPTEPIKTGVALVYGSLDITKRVVGSGSGPFDIQYSCSVTPEGGSPVVVASGTESVAAGQTATVANIPSRASCDVWEPSPPGFASSAPDQAHAVHVTIPVSDATEVSVDAVVTNTEDPALAALAFTGASGLGAGILGGLLAAAGLALLALRRRRAVG